MSRSYPTEYQQSMTNVVIRKDKPSVNSHIKVSGPIKDLSISTKTKEKVQDVSKIVHRVLDTSDDIGDMKKCVTMYTRALGNKVGMSRTAKGFTRAQLGARAYLLTSDIDDVENAKGPFRQSVLDKINKAMGTNFSKRDL